jgi:putative ABC transport system substrate-binding protein
VRLIAVRQIATVLSVLACAPGIANAGSEDKRLVVGQLWLSNAAVADPFDRSFRTGLESQGYVDGKNVTIVPRYAHGDASRFPGLMRELLAQPVDAILVTPAALEAALAATKSVPIICATMGNPVEEGLVKSLAHPGGNLTGFAADRAASDPKRLQLATELVPKLKRLALLFESYPNQARDLQIFLTYARQLGITVKTYEVSNIQDVDAAIRMIIADRPQALIVRASALFTMHKPAVFGTTAPKLPVISEDREYAEAGALISYGPDSYDLYRRAAAYVGRVLRGDKAAELPIEQPVKFILVVNLKTAKALGVTVPESILLLADQIIR